MKLRRTVKRLNSTRVSKSEIPVEDLEPDGLIRQEFEKGDLRKMTLELKSGNEITYERVD